MYQLAYLCSMSATNSLMETTTEARYQLRSIELTTTPEGSEGTWYRYVIIQGISEITGMRPGTQAEVDYAVRDMVERLNERSAGKNTKKPKPVVEKVTPTNDTKLT